MVNTVKKVEKEKLKQYANKVNERVEQLYQLIKELPEEVIRWKPSAEKWSILQVLSHVEEANRYWTGELKRTAANPHRKWGRGLEHPERMAALESIDNVSIEEKLLKLKRYKASIRSTFLNLNDLDLSLETTHRNPKFGVMPLQFLIEHFMVEHLEKHISQVKRNLKAFERNGVTSH
nr:DinB family protein [Halalkalibacterium ligniniphilum]